MDVDGSGAITPDDLREVMGDDYSEEKATQMIAEADKKGTGSIDFDEFWQILAADEEQRVSDIAAPSGCAREEADESDKIGPLEYTSSSMRIYEETKGAPSGLTSAIAADAEAKSAAQAATA